jgi:hypothetical protein
MLSINAKKPTSIPILRNLLHIEEVITLKYKNRLTPLAFKQVITFKICE